jgi:hypothetical protein
MLRHATALFAGLVCSTAVHAQGLMLNEYNGVGSTKFLEINFTNLDEGFDGYFGRIQGNGGNWIELVVTQDHLDVRGWRMRWAETLNFATTTEDLWFGDGLVEQGIVTFSNNPAWADLRKGTILTICEFGSDGPLGNNGKDVDLALDPCRGDWWINGVTFGHPELFTTITNKVGDVPGNFSTGNNGWLMEIVDANGFTRMTKRGEGGPGWGGSGVNSQEGAVLKANPSDASTNLDWDDSDSTRFGTANGWDDFVNLGCRAFQDLSGLRADVLAECASCTPVFLNEYNAVSAANFLNGGTAATDAQGGTAADAFFGRVAGNGGSWFELIVGIDGLDMRGWSLQWAEAEAGGASGTITLASDDALAAIPAGTILTFTNRNAAQGGRDTDLSLGEGDRWMNIFVGDAALVASATNSAGGATRSFITSAREWRIEILDASAASVAGPFGEGAEQYWRTVVGDTSICHLRESPSRLVTMSSVFDESAVASSFGQLNRWAECPPVGDLIAQDLASLPSCVATCFGDLDGSSEVDQGDVAFALLDYGPCPGCVADLDGSGDVDFGDVALILLSVGPCG